MADSDISKSNRLTSDKGGNVDRSKYLYNTVQSINDNTNSSTETPQSFASIVHKFKFPDRNQAIIFDAIENTQKNEYIINVGNLIGPQNIIFASRIANNRICIYLSSKEIVHRFITNFKGITLNDKFITARPLVSPAKRIILSNVSPNIPHETIEEALKREGLNVVSSITFINAGINHPDYKHILSFRRQVYINLEMEDNLPNSMLITHNEITFRIFLSTDEMKCFVCKKVGHIASKCPTYNSNDITVSAEVHKKPNTLCNKNNLTLEINAGNTNISSPPSDDTDVAKNIGPDIGNSKIQSKKRLATSPAELDKINVIPDPYRHTDNLDKLESQSSTHIFIKPTSRKKVKQVDFSSDSMLFPEFKEIFVDKQISYDSFCSFLQESKGKQDVVATARDLNLNLYELLKVLIESIRSVKTNSLKARLKRIAKKLKMQCDFDTALSQDETSDLSISQDCLTDCSDF